MTQDKLQRCIECIKRHINSALHRELAGLSLGERAVVMSEVGMIISSHINMIEAENSSEMITK